MLTYNRSMQRCTAADLINPLGGYRGELKVKGKQVKNHMRMHRKSLANLEEITKKKKTESIYQQSQREI